jgi:hypothetical protein
LEVESTLATCFVNAQPEPLIGDKPYDSDPLGEHLVEQGVKLIAPHLSNRKKAQTQEG